MVDFSNLKKSSGNLDTLKAKVAELNASTEGKSDKENFWRPEVDKAGNGSSRVWPRMASPVRNRRSNSSAMLNPPRVCGLPMRDRDAGKFIKKLVQKFLWCYLQRQTRYRLRSMGLRNSLLKSLDQHWKRHQAAGKTQRTGLYM